MSWLGDGVADVTGARWSAGAFWADEDNPLGTDADWEDPDDWPQTGQDLTLNVFVDGQPVHDRTRQASWRLGQDDLFASLSPGNAALTLEPDYMDAYDDVIIATSGLVGYWPSYASTWLAAVGPNLSTGGTPTSADSIVTNDPDAASVELGTSDTINTSTVTDLKVGDTWTYEIWLRRDSDATGSDYLFVTTGGSDDGLAIILESSGGVLVRSRGGGSEVTDFITTPVKPIVVGTVHHLVVAHDPGDTRVYVDGVLIAGTLTSQVFGDGWSTFHMAIGSTIGITGAIAKPAWYDAKLDQATISEHYRVGSTLAGTIQTPEPGERVVITTAEDVLWTGSVEVPRIVKDVSQTVIDLSCADDMAKAALAEWSGAELGGQADDIVERLMAYAGIGVVASIRPDITFAATSSAFRLQTDAQEGTVLSIVGKAGEALNLAVAWTPSGIRLYRRSLVLPSDVTPTDIDDDAASITWEQDITRCVTEWEFLDETGALVSSALYPESTRKYGLRSRSVDIGEWVNVSIVNLDGLYGAGTFGDGSTIGALKDPPWLWQGELPILDDAVTLLPFDAIESDDYPVLITSIAHSVSPDDWQASASGWRVTQEEA